MNCARRSFFVFGSLVLASGILLGGCHKSGLFVSGGKTKTFVAGQVLDANGNPIPGAQVQVVGSNLGSGVTDGNGVFNVELTALPASGEASVSVTAPGFTTSQRRFSVVNQGTASLEIVSKQVEKVQEEVVTSTPSTITVTTPNDAVEVVLDSSVLGQTGNICFEVTCGNPKVERDIFPGDFVAVDTSQPNGETGLSSIAFTEVKVTNMDTGQEIENLAGSATLTVKIPEGTINPETLEPFKVGDQIPIWSFDEATGLWVRGKDSGGADIFGDVQAGAGSALCAVFAVPHFSWWNMDYPMDQRHCLTGKVVDSTLQPVVNALVTARGVSQNYEFGGVTDSNGNYSFDVFRATTCDVFAELGGRISQVVSVIVPDVQSSILDPATTCTPLDDLQLGDGTCISGTVLDAQGSPIANPVVGSLANGVWTNGEADGTFCLEGLATNATITLTASVIVDGLSLSKDVVVTTGATPSRCIDNNCVTQDIVVDTTTACIAGVVTDLGTGQPLSNVGVWSSEGPWTNTASDGSYCIPATKGATVSVSVSYWDPSTGISYYETVSVTAGTQDGDCNDPTTCTTQDFQIDRATGLITGIVTNELGIPVEGVNVWVPNYPVEATDATGLYLIKAPIQNGLTVVFSYFASNGKWIYEQVSVDVTQPDPASVTLDRALDLELACVQGTVVIGGAPGANVQVSTDWGITTTTDSFGSYCLDVLRNQNVTLNFLETLPGGEYVAHSENIAAATVNVSGSCATGNCVDLDAIIGPIVLNQAPTISSVTAAPNPATSRQIVTADVTATDPDPDTLSYLWSATGGLFTSSNTIQSPTWEAPLVGVQTLFTLTVQVSDGRGGITSSGVVVTVNPPVNNRPVISAMTATPTSVLIGLTSQIDVTASDPDGDALTYTWSTPNGGTAIGNGATVNFLSSAAGTFSVTCVVSDGLLTETATVTVTVTAPANRAPVINSLTATPSSVGRGGASTVSVNASDLDGDPLTYTWSTPGTGTITGSGTSVTFLAPATPGTETVTVTVSDGALNDVGNVNIFVVNTAPTASFTATPNPVSVGGDVTLNASGSFDPEGDALTYSWAASSGTLPVTTGLSVVWTAPGSAGPATITLTVSDGVLNDVISIPVVDVQNLPPVISSLTANPTSTFANQTSSLAVTASDPENTSLSYVWSATGGTTVTPGVPATTATWNGSATTGTFTVTVTVTDAGGASSQSSVNIVVGNRPPVADPQTVNTNEDTTLPITLTGSDPDGDPLTFAITQTTSSGTILLGPLPDLTYTPNAEFSGTDSFTFTVSDGSLTSAPVAVTITVNPVNDAPVADAQAVNTDEDTPLAIILTGSDADGDPLTFAIGTGPTNGSLSGTAPNVTYTPNADFNGADSFTFTTNDGTVNSPAATVSITVNPINDPPVITSVTANPTSVNASATSTITVVASDPDVGDTLTYSYTATGGSIPGTTASEIWTAPATPGGYTITANVFDGTVTTMGNVVVTVLGDTTPPTVLTVVPNNGATGVALNATVVVTFSEVINTATVTGTSFTVNDGGGNIAGTITFSGGNTIATFTPSSPLTTNTTYTVNLTAAIQDTSANALNPTSTTTFQTAAIPPPVITSLSVYSGPVGTVIIINGTDFDPTLGGNTVLFNGTAATLVAGSTTFLQTTLPAGATTGTVTVESFGQTSAPSDTFTVLTPPATIDTTLSVSKALSATQHKFPIVTNGGTGLPDSIMWGLGYANCPSVDRYLVGMGDRINVYESSDDSLVISLAHSGTNDELITDIVVSTDGQTAYAAVAGPLDVNGIYQGSEIQVVTNLGTTPALGSRIDLQAQTANARGPIQVAVTPDGTRLLVLCEDIEATRISGHLVVVDTSTNLATNTIVLPDASGTTYTIPYRMAVHPSGSHAYITVDDADDGTTNSTGMRLLTFEMSSLTFLGGSTISVASTTRLKGLAIRPDGASGFVGTSDEVGGDSFLRDLDLSTPSTPVLGTAHNIGNFYHASDRELVLGPSPDGGMLYVRSHASDTGEEFIPADGVYNELVKGFDVRGSVPVLFDEFYIGATDAFTYLPVKWHFQGARFLLAAPGIFNTAASAQQQSVAHSFRVFPAGAQADLAPFKGGPSGGPLTNSTMTVFVYNELTDMPWPGLNVSLSNNTGGLITSATTDANGIVQFPGLTGPQNITVAVPNGRNVTVFGVDAQNVKIPSLRLDVLDDPRITVVMNGIPGGNYIQGIESSVFEDNGNDGFSSFPMVGDNIRTADLASNERFSVGLHSGVAGFRDRQQFARVVPCSNLVWNANIVSDPDTHTIAGTIVFSSDIPNGYLGSGSFVRGSVKSVFPAEQVNGGSGIQNGGPTSVAGGTMPYSGQAYMVPSGVSNVRWTMEIEENVGNLGTGADVRIDSQKATYEAFLDLGPAPPTATSNANFILMDAPFFLSIGGVTTGTAPGGFFISDSTPDIVLRDTIGPSGSTGRYEVVIFQFRPDSQFKEWIFLIGSTDSARIAAGQVTFTVPDLPGAVASESLASTGNRQLYLQADALDYGAGYDHDNWVLGNKDGADSGQELRSTEVQFDVFLGTSVGTQTTSSATMQQARFNFGLEVLPSGNVFYAGGNTNPGPNTDTAEIYDVTGDSTAFTMDSVPSQTVMSTSRNEVASTLLATGEVLLAGGGPEALPNSVTSDRFDETTGLFTLNATPNMTVGRIGHNALLLNDGRVLVVGGLTGNPETIVPELEIYDPGANSWSTFNSGATPNLLSQRDLAKAIVLNPGGGSPTNILVSGGITTAATRGLLTDGVVSDTAVVISVPNGGAPTFGPQLTMSTPRRGHAMIRIAGGDILLLGGVISQDINENITGLTSTVERYQVGTGTFVAAPGLLSRRGEMASVLTSVSGVPKILLIGGAVEYDGSFESTTQWEIYDPATGAVDAVTFGVDRGDAQAIVVPRPGNPSLDRIVILGGRDDQDNAVDIIEYFDPN